MYSEWIVPALAGLLAVWFGVLSFLVWKEFSFLKSLFPSVGERDIRKKFEEVFKTVDEFKGDLGRLSERLSWLELSGTKHIQRIELIRYNPYEDTGGNVSFSLVVLDKKGSGFVLTSLHARSGTRMFAKEIREGKAQSIKLSKEEEEVLKRAMQ